jgi:hypothetical protein
MCANNVEQVKFNVTLRSFCDTAKSLCSKYPAEDITVKMIMDGSLTSRQTFYRYFPDKYALFNYVFFHDVEEKISTVTPMEFVTKLLPNIFSNDKKFYKSISTYQGQNCFRTYFYNYIERYYKSIALSYWEEKEKEDQMLFDVKMFSLTTVQVFFDSIEKECDKDCYIELGKKLCSAIPVGLYTAFSSPVKGGISKFTEKRVILGAGIDIDKDMMTSLIFDYMGKNPDVSIYALKIGKLYSERLKEVNLKISSSEEEYRFDERILLYGNTASYVMSADNPLAEKEHIKISDFKSSTILLRNFKEYRLLEPILDKYGIGNNVIISEFAPSFSFLLHSKSYVALTSDHGIDTLGGLLKVIPIIPTEYKYHIYLYSKRDSELKPNELRLKNFIINFPFTSRSETENSKVMTLAEYIKKADELSG